VGKYHSIQETGCGSSTGNSGQYPGKPPSHQPVSSPGTYGWPVRWSVWQWQWTQEEQQAFDHLKQRLMEAPILAYPDPAKEYILDIDASDHSVGAVLSQVQGGSEVVMAYYIKTLAAAEKNYCTTRKELLAVVKAVKHFRPYLYGRRF